MSNPETAVIILNWNGAALLREFLPSVLRYTPPGDADVIVVDNGSTDNSRDVLEEHFPEIKTIFFKENFGFAGGYNKAVSEIGNKYKYVLLLNSDVAVTEGWVKTLNEFMDSRPEAGAVQPKILSYLDFVNGVKPAHFEYAGASGGFIDKNGYPFCRGRIFDICEVDEGQYDDAVQVFWATGAALMVRTELYQRVGGLDEKFFAHMEEIDLCWRIHLAGMQVWCEPNSVVYHLGGGSLPADNPRKTYLNFRNNLLLLHKNLPDATRRRKLFTRRLLDALAWLKFVAGADFKNASAVMKAHGDFRKMAKSYKCHAETDIMATRDDTQVNIVTSRYLKRRKKFSELFRRER